MMHNIIHDDIQKILSSPLPFEKLYGKTVIISGANGYVPAYFVYTFLALNDLRGAGIKVFALCRDEKRAGERFADFTGRQDFQLVIQDICKPVDLDEEIHVYIHAASPAGILKRHEDRKSVV